MRPLAVLAVPVVGLLTAGLLAGCGVPPELRETPGPATPPVQTSVPAPTTPPLPTPVQPGAPGTRSPGAFPEEFAIPCVNRPGPEAMLALLRAEGILGPQAQAQVVDGPYCSGTWQYAMVSVPGRDPLLMVSRGPEDDLELVAAGTDVCTVEVRIQAPPGIRSAAAC